MKGSWQIPKQDHYHMMRIFRTMGNFNDTRIYSLSQLKLGGYLVICIFDDSCQLIINS